MSEGDPQNEIKRLKAENLKLSAQIRAMQTKDKLSQRVSDWISHTASTFVVGKGLKNSLARLYDELPGRVTKDTMADVSSHIVLRITRIGMFALSAAIIPLLVLATQTIILKLQNDKLDVQNELISNQNRRLDQQVNLEEGNRRSSFIFLMSNIMDKIDEELKENPPGNRQLSDGLIGRIVSLSQALMPYRYLENDQLIERPLSPERGQLLFSLVNSLLDQETYDKIFDKANFSYADIKEANFTDAYLRYANLGFANFPNANFTEANLEYVNLTGANLDYAYLENTSLYNANLNRASIRHSEWIDVSAQNTNFTRADLSDSYLNGDFTGCRLDYLKVRSAEIDLVNLDGARVPSGGWLDSMVYYDLQGLFSIRENYVMDTEVIQGADGKSDTIYLLRINQDSQLAMMDVCKRTVLDIIRSNPEIKNIGRRLRRQGEKLIFVTENMPAGTAEQAAARDSAYLFRLTTENEDQLSQLLWVRFQPQSGRMWKISPSLRDTTEMDYDRKLLLRLRESCK